MRLSEVYYRTDMCDLLSLVFGVFFSLVFCVLEIFGSLPYKSVYWYLQTSEKSPPTVINTEASHVTQLCPAIGGRPASTVRLLLLSVVVVVVVSFLC